ncbi:uncharacterized protein LOC127352145 [Dicentrarchus labrax]|uniref:Gypsy retrotransposon integrase-like protein 1 n=1 Tax=Dicentrarchus labrax TaxID=13489 RepID=A0A8P4GNT9_DICLA|nr:uncharacterized protein LOC127352145 [Dicentrarchus labrax]
MDSGSDQTLVHRQFVPANVIRTLETIPICCVHGDKKPYPTADIYIEVQEQPYLLNIGGADNLPFPVVLGSDLPVLFDLLSQPIRCNVAVTRAQAKLVDEPSVTLSALPFYDADLDTQPGKSRKSRSRRRQERFQHTVIPPPDAVAPDLPLGVKIPSDIVQMQQRDHSLAALLRSAKEREVESELEYSSGEEYFLQKGILCHQHGPVKQLVVPKAARDTVLVLGHSVPWAGHLGKHKTLARIKRYFHWPGLRADVSQFCRTCPQCQKTSSRGPCRAPLQPLPIVGTPFERLGMDIVGPVERSKSGNRYMLVITDYATKYPEVFPLKSVKAKTVAFSLVQFFSRVCFPQEILTDQGTNFMSTLLKQVYQLLGIKSLRTTPYHPQTDGLTERFNQTLKQMLHASERGIGAVLLQGPTEDQHPVAFISRKLLPREVRYSTVEKEALAIKWALDSYKYYLLGREFTLQTDHKALQWLQRMKDTNGRVTRWYLAMQPFRFIVQHIPGKLNVTADYLSRCHNESSEGGEYVMAALAATH